MSVSVIPKRGTPRSRGERERERERERKRERERDRFPLFPGK